MQGQHHAEDKLALKIIRWLRFIVIGAVLKMFCAEKSLEHMYRIHSVDSRKDVLGLSAGLYVVQ